MKPQRMCPACGKNAEQFVGSLCRDCFAQTAKPVEFPARIELVRCKGCGKARHKGRWLAFGKELVAQIAEEAVSVKGISESTVAAKISGPEAGLHAEVVAKGISGNVPLIFEKKIPIIVREIQCDSCMKLKSLYHEAILQIRGGEKEVEAAFLKAQELIAKDFKKDSLSGIVGIARHKCGIDILVGSKRAAISAAAGIAKGGSAEITRSFKLIGIAKGGKPKKRFTFCVRV